MLVSEIAKYLDSLGIVTFDETGATGDCFISTLPDAPDEVVAIYPSVGAQADGKLGYDLPGVQILIRGSRDPRNAIQRGWDIYNALHGFHHASFVTGGVWVLNCLGIQSGPQHLDRDETGRPEYSMNFELEVRNPNRE